MPCCELSSEKGLLVWGRHLSQARECWASSSSSSMPWLGAASRALGGHSAHRPSHLLPAQTHRLPLKRLHLKGKMEFEGRQEAGGCPALGRGWPVPCCTVAWEESQDPGGVLGGHGGAGAAPTDPGVCWVPGYPMATAAPGGKPVQGLYQRCQVAAWSGFGMERHLPGWCWDELLFLSQPG